MMASKEYTAQDMRKMADCINNIKQSEMPSWKEGEIITGGDMCRAAEMLRQAAEMRERCEEVIADVNGPNSRFDYGIATPDFDANEIVDYILHGDAVKKEKK